MAASSRQRGGGSRPSRGPWRRTVRSPLRPVRGKSRGARLVRQWRGESHCVLVLDDGFLYRDQRYRSLTAIARVITGAHWSGPRFFGLGAQAQPTSGAERG